MKTYTVQSLSEELSQFFKRTYPRLAVEGEISQLAVPNSGHAYFELKDGDAVIRCVAWKNEWKNLQRKPKVGERIVATGKLDVFSKRGSYQFYVREIEFAGEGELQKRIAKTIATLQSEGLIDPSRRRPLPSFPSVVGVVTSLTGAALQDFLRVSHERWPASRIVVSGCQVQGDEAPPSIVRALDAMVAYAKADVIVVTRGGGSKLDLLAFQDEQVARCMAMSPVPIVSAVGHETDSTIADLVADRAAPTPSAAAALVFPDQAEWAQRIDGVAQRLDRSAQRKLEVARERLRSVRLRLKHPAARLRLQRERAVALSRRLHRSGPAHVIAATQRLSSANGRLKALSPYGVLERGFAIVRGPQGVVRDAERLSPGDRVEVRVARGSFDAAVVPSKAAPAE